MMLSTPEVGAARWVAFPSFLFLILRPLYCAGLITTVEDALVPFGLASVIASLIYLACLRGWLLAMGITEGRRWIALTAAAACPGILLYATDTAEPLFGAAFSAMGLLLAARKKLIWGVALMSIALLLHQTLFVAFFLLPLMVHWREVVTLRTISSAAISLGIVGLGTIVVVAESLDMTWMQAIGRSASVYANENHMNWMRGGPLKGAFVTVFGGFPQALITVPGLEGLRRVVGGVLEARLDALLQATRLALGFALVVAGGLWCYRSKRWAPLLALAGFSILPIVWNNVYWYAKFYVLFPFLVVYVLAHIPNRIGRGVAVLLIAANVSTVTIDISKGRQVVAARRAQFGKATKDTWWLTAEWAPHPPYLWRGRSCGMLTILSRPSKATSLSELERERTTELKACLRSAFCSDHPVWTSDWVVGSNKPLHATAQAHGLSADVLDISLWRDASDGTVVDSDLRHPLFVYSATRARDICAALEPVDPHATP
jgi:hypothetical protein